MKPFFFPFASFSPLIWNIEDTSFFFSFVLVFFSFPSESLSSKKKKKICNQGFAEEFNTKAEPWRPRCWLMSLWVFRRNFFLCLVQPQIKCSVCTRAWEICPYLPAALLLWQWWRMSENSNLWPVVPNNERKDAESLWRVEGGERNPGYIWVVHHDWQPFKCGWKL